MIDSLKQERVREDIRAQVREVAVTYIMLGLFKSDDILREGKFVGRRQGEDEEEAENPKEEKSGESKTAASNGEAEVQAKKIEKLDESGTQKNKTGESGGKKADESRKEKRKREEKEKKKKEESQVKKKRKKEGVIVYYDED